MIKFKEGYWYKYIGNENNNDIWWDDERKLLLNGKWHKCIYVDGYWIKFKGMKPWIWVEKDFIESKYNPYIKKLLKEIK